MDVTMEALEIEDEAYDIERMPLIVAMFNSIRLAKQNADYNLLQLQNLIAERTQLNRVVTEMRVEFVDERYDEYARCSSELTALDERIFELQKTVTGQSFHIESRLKYAYQNRMVTAPYLEVNSVETADFALYLYHSCRWRGSICLLNTMDLELRNHILEMTKGISHRTFARHENGDVMLL